jgi:hypothetical protein
LVTALRESKGVCLVGPDLRGVVVASLSSSFEIVSLDPWSSDSMSGFEKMVVTCARLRQLGHTHKPKLIHIEVGDLWAARTKRFAKSSDFARMAGFHYHVVMEFRDLSLPSTRELSKLWKLVELRGGITTNTHTTHPALAKVKRLLASDSCPLSEAKDMAQSDSGLAFILWTNIPKVASGIDYLATDRELWSRMEAAPAHAVQTSVSLRRLVGSTALGSTAAHLCLPQAKHFRAFSSCSGKSQNQRSREEELEIRLKIES